MRNLQENLNIIRQPTPPPPLRLTPHRPTFAGKLFQTSPLPSILKGFELYAIKIIITLLKKMFFHCSKCRAVLYKSTIPHLNVKIVLYKKIKIFRTFFFLFFDFFMGVFYFIFISVVNVVLLEIIQIWDHPFSTYAKCSGKLTFLTTSYCGKQF